MCAEGEGLRGAGKERSGAIWGQVESVEEVGIVLPNFRRLREFLDKYLEQLIGFLEKVSGEKRNWSLNQLTSYLPVLI